MKLRNLLIFVLFITFIPVTNVFAQTDIPWPMAGANPQRTSWVPTTLPDVVATQWVKPIYPLVPQKVQVIGAEGKVYVSTSAGLYAFDAATGADAWKYATALPLGHSPTYSNGFLYVGGLDKKIHKIRAADGVGIWTFTAEGGFVTSPIVANGRVYATSRDGALYAINDSSSASLAWKYETGNQINQSPAYADNTLYFASNDGYGYAVNATTGALVWQSDADPTTPTKDKFPSMGFYSWWPVVYGNDVIFTRTGFYATNGPESSWFFGPSPNANMFVGTQGYETQSGYWPVGEKILDLRTNPNGYSLPDYFETQEANDTRPQHGPYRRNAFFVNRSTGLERQFDLDSDGRTDAAPVLWVGDGGTHPPPVVSGNNNVLYFSSVVRGRGASFNARTIFGWKVGTPTISVSMDQHRASDEPMGITGAGDKLYYNHCCDRGVAGVNISRPNTDNAGEPAREWGYLGGGGLNYFSWPLDLSGLPNTQNNYYYNEAVKFFWDPQPNLDPPGLAAVFWNENDKVGPSAYNGRLYVILGNALVALGTGGAGTNAPRLSSAANVSPPAVTSNITDTQLKARLETEVAEIVSAGHLKPSYMFAGLISGHWSRAMDDYLPHYWHNPADVQLVLLRALPYLSATLQQQVKTYLQNEFTNYNPSTYAHVGFIEGTQRDPWPYPPAETVTRLFTIPTLGKTASTNFNNNWGFPPHNIYALWKYAKAGLGNPATLLSQWGTRLRAPITANNANFTDAYLKGFPLIHNAYIAAYKGYIELKALAGTPLGSSDPFVVEYNRLLNLRVSQLMAFPNPQAPTTCENECYYESLITYYNFAYMTPELGDYLRTNARNSNPDKDILAILQKYQDIAPYWMMVHNGETQGEYAIQPYQQTHSLFQGLALVKRASREELLKYLDTPIVPVGDLYYIDNLVAVLEASSGPQPTATPTSGASTPTPTPTPANIPGDANGDRQVNEVDYQIWQDHYLQSVTGFSDGDFNTDSRVDGQDYAIWLRNFNGIITTPPATPTPTVPSTK